jgi:hemerythrin-like domain-containing protein
VKRHAALRRLSDDHHRALVLARRIRREASGAGAADLEALSREARARFAAELEPHFRIEEKHLFPALAARGESELAVRAADDHAELRRSIRAEWGRQDAQDFGERLERHVRFEERVLFPRAEEILSESELAAVLDGA